MGISRDDVARRAGVSASTVSRALAGSPLLAKDTIDRVRLAAGSMGYHPNSAARNLARRRSGQLGFIMPKFSKRGALRLGYYSDTLEGVLERATELELSVCVSLIAKEEDVKFLLEQLRSKLVDALILIGFKLADPLLGLLIRENVRFICIDTPCGSDDSAEIFYDPEPGMRGLLEKALESGVRELYYLEGDSDYYGSVAQKECMIRLCAERKIKWESLGIGNYSLNQAICVTAARLAAGIRPKMIFAANDRSAVGVMRALQQIALQAGRDVAVAGWDDDEHASLLEPSLATVHQPRLEAGRLAVDLIYGNKKGPHYLPTHYVDGESMKLRK